MDETRRWVRILYTAVWCPIPRLRIACLYCLHSINFFALRIVCRVTAVKNKRICCQKNLWTCECAYECIFETFYVGLSFICCCSLSAGLCVMWCINRRRNTEYSVTHTQCIVFFYSGSYLSACLLHCGRPYVYNFDKTDLRGYIRSCGFTKHTNTVVQRLYTVFRKVNQSHFLSYLHVWFVDLNKNCSEYTHQGTVDFNNVVDIHCDRWRHICKPL